MTKIKKIKVLVVDDSIIFREAISRKLNEDRLIEVVGKAYDAFDAMEKIKQINPDVVTIDIEMPKMNGIEFLKKVKPNSNASFVAVSSSPSNAFDALDAGAVDFVKKPTDTNDKQKLSFFNEIIIKVKIASMAHAKEIIQKNVDNTEIIKTKIKNAGKDKIIIIGASTGGTEAISKIVKEFPKDMPPVIIVQHMPVNFTKMYAQRIDRECNMNAKEAQNYDRVKRGQILIAPGGLQMSVSKDSAGYFVTCKNSDKVNGHKPSVDVLFSSVAKVMGTEALGVILTGMGSDGANGLLEMRKKGCFTIGQDEKSCVVYGMPMVAYKYGAVQEQLPIDKIASRIIQFIGK